MDYIGLAGALILIVVMGCRFIAFVIKLKTGKIKKQDLLKEFSIIFFDNAPKEEKTVKVVSKKNNSNQRSSFIKLLISTFVGLMLTVITYDLAQNTSPFFLEFTFLFGFITAILGMATLIAFIADI